MSVMHGIHEDVPFDQGIASNLVTACNTAANLIEGQTSSRASWVSHGLEDFQGYYSQLFRQNGQTQASDASLLVTRLREVATAVGDLKRSARAEQQRRNTARAWKQRQDDRGLWDHVSDWFTGGEAPPVGPPDPAPRLQVSSPPAPNREPLTGSGGSGTSSARPANLRSFATNSSGANDTLSSHPGKLRAAYSAFQGACHWGQLEASAVWGGFDAYLSANAEDVRWANTVAGAFEAAGSEGVVTTSNAAITASLQSAGVNAQRTDLAIDPPQALGAPPTTGYCNDPVNTATGNFIEPETDLAFDGGCSALIFTRMYNSMHDGVGAFGPGWSSWTEAGLVHSDADARWVRDDGRHLVFPRLGDGWDRATSEAYWLTASDEGHRITDNAGGAWHFDRAGRLTATSAGPGTAVTLAWDGPRLVSLTHERGRSVTLEWGDDRVVAAVASDGRRVDYAYDDAGRLVSATGSRGPRTYTWNDAGLVTAVTDADGVREMLNTYDEAGRVVEQVSAHGRVTRFAYLPGHVTVVSDPDGSRSNTWIHDDQARLVGIVDAHDQRQSLARDKWGNVVLATERDGSVTASEYDDRSRLVGQVLPSGAHLTTTFDDLDRIVDVGVDGGDGVSTSHFSYTGDARTPDSLTDGLGATTLFEWTAGQLTATTDPTGVRVELEYDQHGDLIALGNARGERARLERDDAGRVVASITPLGHRTRFEWEGEFLARRIDPDGATWHFEHSAAGRLVATVDPLGARTELSHDDAGEAAEVTDALGRTVRQVRDTLGNLARVELPDGSTWQFGHDALSRLVAATDPEGGTWRYEYDVVGHNTRVEDPTGRGRLTTYLPGRSGSRSTNLTGTTASAVATDRIGRIVSFTQPGWGSHLTRYDRAGRPVEFVDPEGHVTSLERDAAGRPVALRRPDGATTRYAYDEVGRLASTTLPTGDTYRFTYDADGHLAEEVDPTGATSRYTYDALGRLTESVRPGVGRETWTYDAVGRVVATSGRLWGRRRFVYDAAGQLTEAHDALGGITRFTLDTMGRAVEVTDPTGRTLRRSYDRLGRLVEQVDALGNVARATYDGAGRLVGQDMPTGERFSLSLDPDGALSTLALDDVVVVTHDRDPDANVLVVTDGTDPDRPVTHRLAWDRRGHLIERRRGTGAVRWTWDAVGHCASLTAPDGTTTRYRHDPAGRLVGVATDGRDPVTLDRDGAGRLVSASAGAVTQTWAYAEGDVVDHTLSDGSATASTQVERDDEGRIVAVVRDGVRTRYGYDAAGQLTRAEADGVLQEWEYDAGGRLTRQRFGASVTTYEHDAGGQLLTSTTDGATTTYAHDAAGRRVSEDGPDGRVDFTWGSFGWLAAVNGPQGHTAMHVDALGELARVNDAEVFWNMAERSVAPVQVGDEPVLAVPGFVGDGSTWLAAGWRIGRGEGDDAWTPASGLPLPGGVHLGAAGHLVVGGVEWLGQRVYDADTRSFLSRDPLDGILGSAWSGNPYSYAGNDPLHALDPTGLRPVTDAELATYTHQHHTAGFWERNGTAIAGVGLAIAGGALMFAPFPGAQIVGGMVMSAGFDMAQQGFQNPGQMPDWRSVGLSAAAGAIPGGGGSLGRMVVRGALTGAATNAAQTTILGLWDGRSWGDMGGDILNSALFGGVTGGIGGGLGYAANRVQADRLAPTTPTPTPSPATDLVPVTPSSPPATLPPAPTTSTDLVLYRPPSTELVVYSPTSTALVPVTQSAPAPAPVAPAPAPAALPPGPPPPLALPAPPPGFTTSPGGLYVPAPPPGFSTSPGGLMVPAGSMP